MSETKAKLQKEVDRLADVCREAADLIEIVDDMYEPIGALELARLVEPLRRAIYGAKRA